MALERARSAVRQALVDFRSIIGDEFKQEITPGGYYDRARQEKRARLRRENDHHRRVGERTLTTPVSQVEREEGLDTVRPVGSPDHGSDSLPVYLRRYKLPKSRSQEERKQR